ncbi:MAG: SRPBCC domain-containing protein, partial [Methanothrix sp.]|nr:SRPBCC domain-containing protein [Methanothrix sp.]
FDGEHSFVIEPLGERKVRFIQSEEFNGLMIPFSKSLLNETEQNFNEMNRALKERAEQIE